MQRGEIPVARVASALLALVLLSLPVASASVSKTQCDLLHRLTSYPHPSAGTITLSYNSINQKGPDVEVVWTGSLFERIGRQILCHGKRITTFTPGAVGELDQHLHGR
jgi:hypothetical protein